jgi:hypothetical protein
VCGPVQLQAVFSACVINFSVQSVMHGGMDNRTLFFCIQHSSVFAVVKGMLFGLRQFSGDVVG